MPSFGLLKEQILTNLEKKYSEDKSLFEEGVSQFFKTLLKSKVYRQLFEHYQSILNTHFDDPEYAREYLNETVDYLRSLIVGPHDKSLLESLDRADLKPADIDPCIAALDTLVFSNKGHIKERIEARQLLQQKMLKENVNISLDPKLHAVFLDILQKKIKAKWDNLNESEMKAIIAFSGQNEEDILANYIHLIDDNISTINEQLSNTGDSTTQEKLKQAEMILVEMKQEKPTLRSLEKLFTLKEGFIG